eukprot:g526.t1
MSYFLRTFVLGVDPAPAWFVFLGIPALHGSAITFLQIATEKYGDALNPIADSVSTLIGLSSGTPRGSLLSTLFISACMCLLTFYVFIFLNAFESPKGVDNRNPRANRPVGEPTLQGRVISAHRNHLESFPIFAAAVLAALATGHAGAFGITTLAWIHVLARVAYFVAYAVDLPALRTLTYIIGFDASAFILWRIAQAESA